MARTHFKYSQELITRFVKAVIDNGGNVEATARVFSIPPSTAKKLFHASPVAHDMVGVRRKAFVADSWVAINKILRAVSQGLNTLEPDRIRAYTTLLGMLYDKQSHAMVAGAVKGGGGDVAPGAAAGSATFVSEHTRRIVMEFKGAAARPLDTTDVPTPERDDGSSLPSSAIVVEAEEVPDAPAQEIPDDSGDDGEDGEDEVAENEETDTETETAPPPPPVTRRRTR